MLLHISSTIDKIVEIDETQENLIKDTFNTLLDASNTFSISILLSKR